MNLTMLDKTMSINGVGWISLKSKITEIQDDFWFVIINYVTNKALQDLLEREELDYGWDFHVSVIVNKELMPVVIISTVVADD